ncbi:MAG: esterase family protein [Clostridiaceae bacterium]|jgi:putative tributyrin esterase|nr:esterase family protein [Clostridiaceae bacterium]
MAFIQCNFESSVLGLQCSMNVIMPQYNRFSDGRGHSVLYLFHGLSDDHTIWMRRTSIERYVEGMGLAVIMPAADRSFYTDMRYGNKYWTFISEELPAVVKSLFPVSDKREDTFVAGLSMGGYGAMKLALNFPERYAAAASLSGVMDIVERMKEPDLPDAEYIYGPEPKLKGTNNDLFYLAEKIASSDGFKPKLYQCVGLEDVFHECNVRFHNFCRKLSLDTTYEEEHGYHDWYFWDKKIQSVLKWLPINRK